MFYSTCLLALLLLFSVQGIEVVARVRFSQNHFTVKASPRICVEIVNDDHPASQDFSITFTISTVLLGGSGSIFPTRVDTLIFSASSPTAQLCFRHQVNNNACERDITGQVRLRNSSAVLIGDPGSAHITIQDDDNIHVSFERSMYIINEGNFLEQLFINASHSRDDVQLEIYEMVNSNKLSMVEQSLIFNTTRLPLSAGRQNITLNIMDDDVALEEPEEVHLVLGLSSDSLCSRNVKFSPINSTIIQIVDDDSLIIQLTQHTMTVREGESHRLCISLTKTIARQLDLLLHVISFTADTSTDLRTNGNYAITFNPYKVTTKCIEIPTIRDDIIEEQESFSIELTVVTPLQTNMWMIRPVERIRFHIEDASSCITNTLDPINNGSTLYVTGRTTLCFSCNACSSPSISWNLISYEGHIWTGDSGENLSSEDSPKDRGEVYSNGTLLVTNSSSVFSTSHPGIIRFSEQGSQDTWKYNVYLGEAAVVMELTISLVENTYKLTCTYKGSPQPNIEWLVNSVPLTDIANQADITRQGYFQSIIFLNISDAVKHSKYTCRVSNSFGSDMSELTIQSPTDSTTNKDFQLLPSLLYISALFAFTTDLLYTL